MRIAEKYLLNKLLIPFLYCLVLMIAIYLMIDLATFLRQIVRQHIPFNLVLKYYYYSLPTRITEVIPMSVLVATIYSLTKLNKHNEILAMRAGGIGWLTILRPYFTFAILISFTTIWMNEKVVPVFYQRFYQIKQKMEKSEGKLLENITFYAEGNRIIYAREFKPSKNLFKNVIILEQTYDQSLIFKLVGEKLYYRNGKWFIEKGMIYKLNSKGHLIDEPVAIDKKELNIKEKPKDFLKSNIEAKYLKAKELFAKLLSYGNISPQIRRNILMELYHKFSYPFSPLILSLIGIIIGIRSSQTSLIKGLVIALAIGFLYYGLDAITFSFGKIGILPCFLSAWLANIVFLTIGIIFFIRKIVSHS
jgi:lipopolysaccharide export system permease protein